MNITGNIHVAPDWYKTFRTKSIGPVHLLLPISFVGLTENANHLKFKNLSGPGIAILHCNRSSLAGRRRSKLQALLIFEIIDWVIDMY